MTLGRDEVLAAGKEFLGHPRLVTAITSVAIGIAVFAHPVRQLTGWAGLVGALAVLVALAAASIVARWRTIEWRGLLPVSLIVFLAWAGLTLLWSQYQWATLWSLLYLAAFTILALYVALLRDTIQIVRAFGDVLRVALGLSIALEILSGLLLDTEIRFLGILGNLDSLGPIQGVAGTRNQLGILAVLALITFGTEYRTKSVPRGLAIGSLVAAGLALLLTRSPVAIGGFAVVCVAAAALYGLRRVADERRRYWQIAILVLAVIGAGLTWIFRSAIIDLLNAGGELSYRLAVWYQAWSLIGLHPLEGWGWVGTWRADLPPYSLFQGLSVRSETSASNAYLDVWFQLGLVGLVIFLGLLGLAFTRSWLLASRRRSVVFAWPALVLVALLTTALAESSILIEFGWLTFVVCAVKAAEQLSWRQAFQRLTPADSGPADLPRR
ncbi:O-antigen ligase family protein [Schumannella luteola]